MCFSSHFRQSQSVFLHWESFFADILCGATRCRVMSRSQGCAAAQSLRGGWPSSKAPQREGLLWISFFSDALGRPRACFRLRDYLWSSFLGFTPLPRHAAVERASVAVMFTSPGPYVSVEWPARMRRPREQFSARKLRRPLNTAALASFSEPSRCLVFVDGCERCAASSMSLLRWTRLRVRPHLVPRYGDYTLCVRAPNTCQSAAATDMRPPTSVIASVCSRVCVCVLP